MTGDELRLWIKDVAWRGITSEREKVLRWADEVDEMRHQLRVAGETIRQGMRRARDLQEERDLWRARYEALVGN